MRRLQTDDHSVGSVIEFRDQWCGRTAMCLLIGSGSGPEGESVRIVGRPIRGSGFTVHYVRSYEGGIGNARRAYEYLVIRFGHPLSAVEIVSQEGIGFHKHLLAEGILSAIKVELDGYEPSTGDKIEVKNAPNPRP